MSLQIIKQPDGRLALFSSEVDDWILIDADPEEVEAEFVARAVVDTLRRLRPKIQAVQEDRARDVYYQFTLTYQEALEAIEIGKQWRNGDEEGDEENG